MTILLLDPCPEDRMRTRAALAGAVEGPFVEVDPMQPLPDDAFADVHLAILETDLPGETGFDLLARLRLLRPDLPVVVVTRRVEEARVVAAMKAGACDHVGKGRLDRLPDAAREALAGRGAMRAYAPSRSALESVGAIAHDLRNVLQSIRLAVDLLRRIPDEARRVPLLDTVVAGIARGRDLLSEMLVVARPESPNPPPPEEPTLRVGVRPGILVTGKEPEM